MLKKTKRVTSLFLTATLIILLFAPAAVSAAEADRAEKSTLALITETEDALCSFRGSKASTELCQSLATYDINVEDQTLIEVIPSSNGSNGNTLVVTNIDGTLIEKSIVTAVNAEGEQQAFASSSTGGSWTLTPFNDSFVLVMMVEYRMFATDVYLEYYYQPVNAMYIYYNPDKLYSVTDIRIDYLCWGFEMEIERDSTTNEITGYTLLTPEWEQTYQHYITVDITAPKARTYYSANNAYRTDRVIDTNHEMVGSHMLYYDMNLVKDGEKIHLENGMDVAALS